MFWFAVVVFLTYYIHLEMTLYYAGASHICRNIFNSGVTVNFPYCQAFYGFSRKRLHSNS